MSRSHSGSVQAASTAGGPLASFITFTTFGTRLHGDDRGSVDREHNAYGQDLLLPEKELGEWERSRMIGAPILLGEKHRPVVERAIREAGEYRDWTIHALNVRTNHVHVVVGADSAPEPVMNTMKSWATRRLREAALVTSGGRTWTRHGSTRYLWRPTHIASACRYVLEQQGDDLSG